MQKTYSKQWSSKNENFEGDKKKNFDMTWRVKVQLTLNLTTFGIEHEKNALTGVEFMI